ncbi:hypothetical protein DTW90_23865 [Neorhizobium sp. P12A]|uniref:hypothetical protein n=1 Tax=Neorhizobium sp. P12A TaxID=2268027 RepID=UPI0011EF5396|nr:hypothetical protein [Neorhizobium sp. P12A]KAA0694370.1 hypothetical protein DTW90_23865 [Neorhizobium sp. P12A]
MSDFDDAIQAGISAALEATKKRAEIAAIMKEIAKALEAATESLVTLQYKKITPTLQSVATMLTMGTPTRTKPYWAIVAKSKKDNYEIQIAEAQPGDAGYPFSIEFDGGELVSHDRQSLIAIMKELLSSPLTGEQIIKIQERAKTAK